MPSLISRARTFASGAWRHPWWSLLLAPAVATATPAFERDVRTFFQTYCLECHTTAEAKGGMDLEIIQRPEDFLEHPTALTHVIEVMENGDMPPRKAKQPAADEAERALQWLVAELARQQNAAPNDPGIVVSPRLNSAEYGNAIRHVTDTEAFDASNFITAEGGAGEGFANVGEAHGMGTSTFESYLAAASRVLSHGRFTAQSGATWFAAPQVEAGTAAEVQTRLRRNWSDWQSVVLREASEAHIASLRRQTGMSWGAYVERAWRLRHAAELRLPWRTVEDAAAAEPRLFPLTLANIQGIIENRPSANAHPRLVEIGRSPFIADLRQRLDTLQPAALSREADQRKAFQELEKWFERHVNVRASSSRGNLEKFENAMQRAEIIRAWKGGVARLVADIGASKTGKVVITLADAGDGNEDDFVILDGGEFIMADGGKRPLSELLPALRDSQGRQFAWGTDARGGGVKPNQIGLQAPLQIVFDVPKGARRLDATVRAHPLAPHGSLQISVDDRPPETTNGRILSVPIFNDAQSRRAKAFINASEVVDPLVRDFGRLLKVNEDSAFYGVPWMNADLARFLKVSWPQKNPPGDLVFRLTPAELLELARPEIRTEAESIARQLTGLGQPTDPVAERAAAEKLFATMAERAWRRPATQAELTGLTRLYETDRAAGLSYDFAVKTALKAVLVSPEFLYRFQESKNSPEPYRLANRDLAIRLAFFLWAAPPDKELLTLAADGRLAEPATLRAQARRMLADPRAGALATEFAGQWLHFAGFEDFTGPDAEKFKEFTSSLRRAMADESRLFLLDLLQNNRPLENLIDSDYAFLNDELAKHYGLPPVKGRELRRVPLPADTPRGGLLGMGSVLTKHSAPLRTSPIKRGVWVYEQILGVRLPPPPPVPLISDDETNAEGLTIAQQVERHRKDPACSSCHAKFDALGFALENFDPIGRWRTKDGAGNPVETNENIHTGQTIAGLEGLRAYLRGRMDEVVLNFCRKLTGYALGRGVLVTDKPLLDEMAAAVKSAGNRPHAALDVLLASRQFLYRRDEVATVAVSTPAEDRDPRPALVPAR